MHLSAYTLNRRGTWLLDEGAEWKVDSIGLLHVMSIDEPTGSILIRKEDGEVVAIEGLDSTGRVLGAAIEHFGLASSRRIRAERPKP